MLQHWSADDPSRPAGAGNKKWFLSSWAHAGDPILTDFLQFPRLATYWTDPAELIFNPSLQVQLTLDHIIRDNLALVSEAGDLGLGLTRSRRWFRYPGNSAGWASSSEPAVEEVRYDQRA